MPSLPFTQALTASQRAFNPLSGWQFEYAPWPAAVSVMVDTTGAAGTVEMSVTTGSQTIQERAPVQAGGTAGVTPSQLNNAPLTFIAQPGDRLKLSIDETAAATPTVNGLIQIEPLG